MKPAGPTTCIPYPLARRRFLELVSGGLLAAPLAAEAQSSPKRARLGILAPTSTRLPQYVPFRQALWDLGYQNEVTLSIEERAAEGKAERLSNLAVELVRGNVDVILPRDQRPRYGPRGKRRARYLSS